jgi:hypothetical protein
MSIQSEIDRIISVRDELRVALQNKGATLTDGAVLADFVGAVNNLSIGSDIDFTGVTVTAGSMLKDVVAINADGTKVTGSIPTVKATLSGDTVTVPAGYIATKQTFTVDAPELPNTTVTAADLRSGVTAINGNGEVVTGTMPNGSIQTPTVTFNNDEITFEVTVKGSKGYYDSAISKKFTLDATTAMESAVPELSLNFLGISGGEGDKACVVLDMSTYTPGYLKSSWTLEESNTIPAVPYTVYTPGTEDQSIGSDQWINGAQVIKGDSNLVAGNIKKGITIFNVTGTLEAESPELPEVSITADKLLTGYTALDSNGNVVSGSMPYSQQIGHEGGGFIVEYTAGYLPDGMRETAPSATITETDTAVTVGMGWVNQSKTFNKVVSGGGTDTSDGNATPDEVVAGSVFYNKDGRQVGTMKDISVEGCSLRILSDATSTATSVTPYIIFRGDGSFAYGRTGGVRYDASAIDSYPYTTHTPGTSDKILEHGHWLSGNQIIKGDSNLKAANIKKGVSIFGVNGSLETSSGSTGGGSFVKVTNFIAPHDAYTAVTAINVTGWGLLYNEDYGEEEDFSKYNGVYAVTPATANEQELTDRVFKHPTEEMYIFFGQETENGDGDCWFFSKSPDDFSSWSALAYKNGKELPNGQFTWYKIYSDSPVLTTTLVATDVPAQPLVLSGASAKLENGEWVIGEAVGLSGYDEKITPLKYGIYAVAENKLIGDAIAYHTDMYMPTDGLLAYFPMDDSGNIAVDVVNGLKLTRIGKRMVNGVTGVHGTCWENFSEQNNALSGINTAFDLPEEFTISACVFYNGQESWRDCLPIVDFGSREKSTGFGIRVGGRETARYSLRIAGDETGDHISSVPNQSWHTITFSWQKKSNGNFTAKGYLDGQKVYESDWDSYYAINNSAQISMFGRDGTFETVSISVPCKIDEVMLWNRVLSAEEIATLVR